MKKESDQKKKDKDKGKKVRQLIKMKRMKGMSVIKEKDMHAVSACTLRHKELVLPHAACFAFFLPSCFHVFLPHALSSKQVEVSFNGKST